MSKDTKLEKEASKRLDEFLARHKNWRRPGTDQRSAVCDTVLRARIGWFPIIWEWWGFLSPKDDESKVLFRCGGHSPEEVLGLLCGVLNRMCNNMNEGEDNDERRANRDQETA